MKRCLKIENWKLKILVVAALMLFAAPSFAAAQQVSFPYWPGVGGQPPLLPCTGLECTNWCQLLTLAQRLIYFGITLAVEGIAPIFLIWGGFLMLISGGSEERLSKGKTVLTSTIIGMVLALGAFLIVNTFLWLLGNDPARGGVSWPNIACEVPPP